MNCREFVEFLFLYIDNELAPDERREFDSHLLECPQCVAYLDSFRKTVALVQQKDSDELIENAPEELIQAILVSRDSPR